MRPSILRSRRALRERDPLSFRPPGYGPGFALAVSRPLTPGLSRSPVSRCLVGPGFAGRSDDTLCVRLRATYSGYFRPEPGDQHKRQNAAGGIRGCWLPGLLGSPTQLGCFLCVPRPSAGVTSVPTLNPPTDVEPTRDDYGLQQA